VLKSRGVQILVPVSGCATFRWRKASPPRHGESTWGGNVTGGLLVERNAIKAPPWEAKTLLLSVLL
jgi:hypothetical protein